MSDTITRSEAMAQGSGMATAHEFAADVSSPDAIIMAHRFGRPARPMYVAGQVAAVEYGVTTETWEFLTRAQWTLTKVTR